MRLGEADGYLLGEPPQSGFVCGLNVVSHHYFQRGRLSREETLGEVRREGYEAVNLTRVHRCQSIVVIPVRRQPAGSGHDGLHGLNADARRLLRGDDELQALVFRPHVSQRQREPDDEDKGQQEREGQRSPVAEEYARVLPGQQQGLSDDSVHAIGFSLTLTLSLGERELL